MWNQTLCAQLHIFLVIQEAYSSRYKSAMHIRAFDKAVKRYRQRVHLVNPISGRRGRRLHFRGRTTEPPPPQVQGKDRSASCSSSTFTLSHAQAAAKKQKLIESGSYVRAQESLEALPRHVLRHAKTFDTYIRLFVDEGNTLGTRRGTGYRAMTSGGLADVSVTLRKLLDDIAVFGRIGKARQEEILQDPDAKHVSLDICRFVVLNIESLSHRLCSC